MLWLTSPLRAISLLVLLGVSAAVVTVLVQVRSATHPPRHGLEGFDFASVMADVAEVEFDTVDDVRLRGWSLRGEPGRPTILLCHDLGSSKTALANLALFLRKSGFSLLLFDFRGHGTSEGSGSTLGLKEKRDVLAAIDFIAELDGIEDRRVGIYGAGIGAHAAVLAAAERAAVRVLVLDRLYPDVAYPLLHDVYSEWSFGRERLGFVPRGIFTALNRTSITGERAEDVLAGLTGRDVLLLAPAQDRLLAAEMKRMYGTIPDQPDADGNLVVLPATQADGLYGDALGQYHERVADFFESRFSSR